MDNVITCIGEPLGEITEEDGLKMSFGGDVLNTAVYCARAAGDTTKVRLVTALGPDVVSDAAERFIQSEGINADFLRRHDTRPMGLYAIRTDSAGERSFHYWRTTSAARTLFEDPAAPEFGALQSSDIIYLSGITVAILTPNARAQLLAALRSARSRGSRVAFDSNYRPTLWESPKIAQETIGQFWRVTDVALPTIEDEQALFGHETSEEIITLIRQSGVQFGALKCGAAGPVPFPWSGAFPDFPPAVKVIDTTGAGDSFNGAYLAEIANGGTPQTAVRKGHETARKVVGKKGAII